MKLKAVLALFGCKASPKNDGASLMYSKDVPGIAIRKWTLGKEVVNLNQGLREIDSKTKIEPMDKWHIGSCTKSMTSYLIALLVQNNKLKFQTTLKEVFPDFKFKGKNGEIQIEHLLAHRGGLEDVTEIQPFWNEAFKSTKNLVQQRQEFSKLVLERESHFSPGSKNEYSNSGYVILGAVIEKMTGKSWEEVISRDLFNPLQMKGCGFGAAATKDMETPDQTVGHYVKEGKLTAVKHLSNEVEPSDNPAFLGPAGTVHCDMQSWGTFIQEMLNASHGKSLLLKSDIAKRMFSEGKDHHAFGGWGYLKKDWAKGVVYTMVGSNTMNNALYIVAPDLDSIYFGAVNAGSDEALATLSSEIKKLVP